MHIFFCPSEDIISKKEEMCYICMLYKTVDMLIFYNDAAGKIFLYCLFCIKQTFETVHNKQDISTFLQLYSNILKESGEVFCLFNKRSKRLKCLFREKMDILHDIQKGSF